MLELEQVGELLGCPIVTLLVQIGVFLGPIVVQFLGPIVGLLGPIVTLLVQIGVFLGPIVRRLLLVLELVVVVLALMEEGEQLDP